MKIYLAASAPGNESSRKRGMLDIPKRLLSYFFIKEGIMENNKIFMVICNENLLGKWHACHECQRQRESWIKLINNRLLSYWDIKQDQFNVVFAFNSIEGLHENLFCFSGTRKMDASY